MKYIDFVSHVADFEGYSPIPYVCPSGKLTIGYGKRISSEQIEHYRAYTKQDFFSLLNDDLTNICHEIIKYFEPESPFSHRSVIYGLTDFVYNCGFAPIKNTKSYKLAKLFNKITCKGSTLEDLFLFSSYLLNFHYSNKKPLKGLMRRRIFDFELLCSPFLQKC